MTTLSFASRKSSSSNSLKLTWIFFSFTSSCVISIGKPQDWNKRKECILTQDKLKENLRTYLRSSFNDLTKQEKLNFYNIDISQFNEENYAEK